MSKLKLQYFGHLMRRADIWKDTDAGKDWRWEGREGDDRGWDSWLASSTQWTWVWVDFGVGDGQGGLVCCSPRSHKESDVTEPLNWKNWTLLCTWWKYSQLPSNLFCGWMREIKLTLEQWLRVLTFPEVKNLSIPLQSPSLSVVLCSWTQQIADGIVPYFLRKKKKSL